MAIKNELDKLKEYDVSSLILFSLYKLIGSPEYEVLSEMAYVLDRKNMIRFIEMFGGMTIRVPTISELETRTFLTNSDAHSLPKIAREYNKILVNDISFKELLKALKNKDGRKIVSNYGMDPKLGKYHRTYCEVCGKNIAGNAPVTKCDTCDSKNITMGVYDRIEVIKDKNTTKSPKNRPPYVYQIPLTFIPGLGGKTIDKLLNNFETEMNILHKLSKDDIEAVVGEKVANNIINSIEGNIKIEAGRRRSIRKNSNNR